MPLQGPCQEDLRKIHAEINQIVNQRFLLTTAAISTFGVVFALLIPRPLPERGDPIGGFVLYGSALLLLLLSGLYFHAHGLLGISRIYSIYLIITQSSGWEADWAAFRKDRYWAYTKTQSVIFALLGLSSASFPVFLAVFLSLKWKPVCGLIALGLMTLAYEISVLGVGFWKWWDPEEHAKRRWVSLARPQETPE